MSAARPTLSPRGFWLQVGVLALICGGIFVALRMAPVEPCEVLHYGDYLAANNEVEFCGEEDTSFIDLVAVRFPVDVSYEALDPAVAGQPVTLDLSLKTSSGTPLQWDDLAVTHTERLHLMVVDEGLRDYQHLHPTPLGAPGHYTITFTPRHGGTYALFFDFLPLVTARRALARSELEVAGPAEALPLGNTRTASVAGYTFALEGPAAAFPRREEVGVRLRLIDKPADATGQFGLVMGAYAHLVAFDPAQRGFAHLHPRNPFWPDQDPLDPELDFAVRFDEPGSYRLWAQIVLDGQELMIPFDLTVASS